MKDSPEILPSNLKIYESGEFKYVDSGGDPKYPTFLLLHGLLGDPDGWFDAASALASNGYRAIAPYLSIDKMPRDEAHVQGISDYVRSFTTFMNLDRMVLMGSSLGGQIAIRYTSEYPENVVGLLLSGSAGIYETEIGKTTFRRHDRDYIRKKAAKTFYDPAMVTDELVERIYDLATNRFRALRFVWVARSSMHDLVIDDLKKINVPSLLIWGTEDQITPPDVAYSFKDMLPGSELRFIEKCGHAPMMEHPDTFNKLMLDFVDCMVGKETAPV